jgi:predicted nucleic acid-binding Zn ribbon protein
MPMDDADIAQNISENFLKDSLNKRSRLTIPFSGKCLSCGEPVDQRRFCDSDCRHEYEANLKRRMLTQSVIT